MGLKNKYRIGGTKPNRGRHVIIFGLVFVFVAIGILVFFVVAEDSKTQLSQSPTSVDQQPVKTGSIDGRYLFNGTIVLARAVERAANGDYAQPFSQLSTFEPHKYDGWLADLECPVTNNNVSYQQQIDNLVFNCRTEWLPELTKYFSMINLANNHTSDMGVDGFAETQKNLQQAGIQTVGNYDPAKTSDACEVIALPVRIRLNGSEEKASLPVALCAFHYFFRKPNPGEMDVITEFAKIMPVFGLMHVGVEYLPTAGAEQQAVARTMIDNGSEFVIGNSPHWVQNSEVYKGKPIFYSTGNFIFDQLEYETNRGLSVDVQFSLNYDENTAKWLSFGQECKDRADNCLEKARQLGLQKPQLKLLYEPVASVGGNRAVTRKADAEVQKAVEERLNWLQTKELLGQ